MIPLEKSSHWIGVGKFKTKTIGVNDHSCITVVLWVKLFATDHCNY